MTGTPEMRKAIAHRQRLFAVGRQSRDRKRYLAPESYRAHEWQAAPLDIQEQLRKEYARLLEPPELWK